MRTTLHAAAVALVMLAGCIDQKLTITSAPPGAAVWVSDVEKGRTPLIIDYTYTGDYAIELRLDGYQTLKTHANIKPAWYQIPPMDFFAELWPGTIHDHRYLDFTLEKLVLPGNDQLIQHAEELRREASTQPATRRGNR